MAAETMMVLGDFVFSIPTMVYQELSRRSAWTYGRNKRIGARDGAQFLGPGEDNINLAGYLVPQVAGDASSIERVRKLADRGEAQPLVGGDGTVFGPRLITSLEERRSHLFADGSGRRYDFSIELLLVDDDDALDPRAKTGFFDETVDVDDAEKDGLSEDEKALLAGTTDAK